MGNPTNIDFIKLDSFSDDVKSYSNYFEAAPLTNTRFCSLTVENNSSNAFLSNQTSIDLLGNLLDLESKKLGNVSSSYKSLEETLANLYSGNPYRAMEQTLSQHSFLPFSQPQEP